VKSPDNPDHHTVTESLAITVGDYFPVGDRRRRLTPRLAEATNAARSVLIEVAQHREVITYGELSDSIGRSVPPRPVGAWVRVSRWTTGPAPTLRKTSHTAGRSPYQRSPAPGYRR